MNRKLKINEKFGQRIANLKKVFCHVLNTSYLNLKILVVVVRELNYCSVWAVAIKLTDLYPGT